MNKWFTLAAYATFISCSNPQTQDNENFYRIELASLLDKEPQKMSLEQWSKKVHYIPLQTNDSIQGQSIQKIILDDSKLLIVHSDRLSLFDLEGKYLHQIGRKGEGVEEYNRFFGLAMRNDTFFISNGNHYLKLYNWEGKYIGEIPTPRIRYMSNLFPITNSDVFLGYIENPTGQSDKKYAFFCDTTILKIIPNQEKYVKTTDFIVWRFPFEMKSFDGTIPAFKELYNDTIYKTGTDFNLHPYAVINLGKHKANKEFIFALTPEMATRQDLDIFDGKIAITVTGEKDSVIYMTHYDTKYTNTFSYHIKKQKAYYEQILYSKNYLCQKYFVPRFISTDNKYLIDYGFTQKGNKPVIILVER